MFVLSALESMLNLIPQQKIYFLFVGAMEMSFAVLLNGVVCGE